MKILLASDAYFPMINGVVISTKILKEALESRGHDVRVLTVGEKSKYLEDQKTYYLASRSTEYFYPEARVAFMSDHQLRNAIMAWGPDLVHSQSEFSIFLQAKKLSRLLGIPWVHTYHTAYENYTHYSRIFKGLIDRHLPGLLNYYLKDVDLIITPSQKTRASLEGFKINKRIEVLATGIDLSPFAKKISPEKRQALRASYGLGKEDLVLLFLGRLGEEKNLEEALSYFSRLEDPRIKFLIVGMGPLYKSLCQEAKALGLGADRLIFAGKIPHTATPSYYQMADLFLSASVSETQGLTYIEALASGLPVLARKDPCQEGVLENNLNGYRYESFEDFKAFIGTYQKDLDFRDRLSKTAYSRAQAGFSSQEFAAQMEAYYLEVLSQKGSQARKRGLAPLINKVSPFIKRA
ncbi:MAG: glycosyltransferase [Tissierellia bacterium]|nr:glycosyltransferase [Tissierellia bacterium]